MKLKWVTAIAAGMILAASINWIRGTVEAGRIDPRTHPAAAQLSGNTDCEPSIPLSIELRPMDKPEVGRWTRLQLTVDSGFDPDVIRDIRVEYDFPNAVRLVPTLTNDREWLKKAGQSRNELRALIPDERKYALRARVFMLLRDGQTVSQTATRWIDLGEEDPPEGLIGRIINPDGTSIIVYQGATTRNSQ